MNQSPEPLEQKADLLVVGLGPAGVACALAAFRHGLNVLAVGDEPVGGLVRAARKLSKLPVHQGISGSELARRLSEQLASLGVPLIHGRVTSLTRSNGGFTVALSDGTSIGAKTVCLATGTRVKAWSLAVNGGNLHRDARTFAPQLAGRKAVVIGGGEAALDTALTMRDRGAEVSVLVRGDAVSAAPHLKQEIGKSAVRVCLQSTVERVAGEPGSWVVECGGGDTYKAHELAVCIGREPRDELVRGLLPAGDPLETVETSVPGLFMAGDLIRGRDRYVATAMDDGQRAAIAAARFLRDRI